MSYHSLPVLAKDAGTNVRVVIVCAHFNTEITDIMLRVCQATLIEHGVLANDIIIEKVPGALEIPVVLKWCEGHYQPQAMIALGCVIRGETYHFELVCQHSARAIMDLSLSLDEHRGLGIANGILTCNTREQALARQELVAQACARTAILLAQLKNKCDDRVAL